MAKLSDDKATHGNSSKSGVSHSLPTDETSPDSGQMIIKALGCNLMYVFIAGVAPAIFPTSFACYIKDC